MGLMDIIGAIKQEKEKEMRIVMMGLDNAGKTTILKRWNGEDITNISPTQGFNVMGMTHKGLKLNIWDIGGREMLRPYWPNYYEEAGALIWVVDSADLAQLEESRSQLHSLLKDEQLADATLLVLANKQDLPSALSLMELEKALDIGSITNRDRRVVACSAVDDVGLLEGLDFVANDPSSQVALFL